MFPFGNIRFQLKLRNYAGGLRLNKKIEIFIWSHISKFLRPAQRYDDFKLINEHDDFKLINEQNCCRPTCRCHHLGYSVPPALHRTSCRPTCRCHHLGYSVPPALHRTSCRPTCRCHHLGYSVPPALHRTIWCRSTFGPRGPGLSNPTSFLRPALPMAPTRDDNARDERSVPRPNPATFLRDFARYMTLKYAIIRKRCLNYTACLTVIRPVFPFGNIRFQLKLRNYAGGLRLIEAAAPSLGHFHMLVLVLARVWMPHHFGSRFDLVRLGTSVCSPYDCV